MNFLYLFSLAALLLFLLAVAGQSCWRWWAFRKLLGWAHRANLTAAPRAETPSASPFEKSIAQLRQRSPRVSIVVVSDRDADALFHQLPRLLEQDFENFEVIVVDHRTDEGETEQLVKQLRAQHSQLRYTYVPTSLEAYHAQRMLLTLGIRAARSPWVLIMQPDAQPTSNHWLTLMMEAAEADGQAVDFVVGYSNYDFDPYESMSRRSIHQRMLRFARQGEALLRGSVLGIDACNLLLRKEWLLHKGAFAEVLDLAFGESHFFLAKHGVAERGRLVLSPESFVRQPMPSSSMLRQVRRQARQIRRRHPRPNSWCLLRERFANVALVVSCLSLIGLLLLRTLRFALAFAPQWFSTLPTTAHQQLLALCQSSPAAYTWWDLSLDLPCAVLIVFCLIAPIVKGNELRRLFGETPLFAYHHGYALRQLWRTDF